MIKVLLLGIFIGATIGYITAALMAAPNYSEIPTSSKDNLAVEEGPKINEVLDKIRNATNGDMIKVVFPNCKDWKAKIEDNDGEVYEVHFAQLPNSITINKYEESWWNAPYKAESEDKE